MLYRDIHHASDQMDQILVPLHRALLAGSVTEMAERAGKARTAAEEMLLRLQKALRDSAGTPEMDTGDGAVERTFTQAAVKALQRAIDQAQQARDVADISTLRVRLLAFMTQADFADAYLRVAIGQDQSSEIRAG